MAININHPTAEFGRINPPQVQIAGKEVDTTGAKKDITRIYNHDHQRLIGRTDSKLARDVDARALDIFNESVTVTINADPSSGKGFVQPVWRKAVGSRESNDNNIFFGEQPGGLGQNQIIYTYYTLNGTDPNRTKANLYTGPFTVRQNKSGGDNYVLKTRSYWGGNKSTVRRVDFRIVENRRGNDYREINKLTIDASAF